MEMRAGLFQQQTTSLNMTQGLVQAISLLQYSMFDLSNYIQEKANENPLIDVEDHYTKDIIVDKVQVKSTEFTYNHNDSTLSPFDFIDGERRNLHDHLINQIHLQHLSKIEVERLSYFIFHVNEDGYLTQNVKGLCGELEIPTEEGEHLLLLLQSLEPVGVGARNLQECLLLQLRKKSARDMVAEVIVSHYIEMFAARQWKMIAKELSITLHEIQKVHDLIQTLQPRPGVNYSSDVPKYIIADVSVIEVDGELIVTVNDEYMPKVRLNAEYKSLLTEKNIDIHHYIKEKYEELQWLLKSINQRQVTLYRVAKAIVEVQKDYFYQGSQALKPLTLRQIAEEIDIHESTVSRITSNKYIETPRGLFELKYFFTNAISGTHNSPTTSSYVKEIIKGIIEKENKLKPLSDQTIMQLLNQDHQIDLSRRVIAKYRDDINIPSSSNRKRFIEEERDT